MDVVYGDVNPSAKLPYTIAKKSEDYSAQVVYSDTSVEPQIPYTEGLLIDYRWFDAVSVRPPFRECLTEGFLIEKN